MCSLLSSGPALFEAADADRAIATHVNTANATNVLCAIILPTVRQTILVYQNEVPFPLITGQGIRSTIGLREPSTKETSHSIDFRAPDCFIGRV